MSQQHQQHHYSYGSSNSNIPVIEVYWSLVAKADKKFSKIRDLPYYQRNRLKDLFFTTFDVLGFCLLIVLFLGTGEFLWLCWMQVSLLGCRVDRVENGLNWVLSFSSKVVSRNNIGNCLKVLHFTCLFVWGIKNLLIVSRTKDSKGESIDNLEFLGNNFSFSPSFSF